MLKIPKNFFKSIFIFVSLTMHKAAYLKSSSLNDQLINKLVSDTIVKSPSVEKVMRLIDRGDFSGGNYAYYDSPTGIGYSATISAPHMHAWALV